VTFCSIFIDRRHNDELRLSPPKDSAEACIEDNDTTSARLQRERDVRNCINETKLMSQLATAGSNAERLKLLAKQVILSEFRLGSRVWFTSRAQPL
jgi:hypothetical protein